MKIEEIADASEDHRPDIEEEASVKQQPDQVEEKTKQKESGSGDDDNDDNDNDDDDGSEDESYDSDDDDDDDDDDEQPLTAEEIAQLRQKTIEDFTAKAKDGDANAMYELGHLMATSSNSSRRTVATTKEQMHWWSMGAEKGHGACVMSLAALYRSGAPGVIANMYKMRKILLKGSEAGDGESVDALGQFYSNCGDEENAARAYIRAASLGIATGFYHAGLCFFHGKGVQQDYSKAGRYWHQGAQQEKQTGCMLHLAMLCMRGIGCSVDGHKAVELLEGSLDDDDVKECAANNLLYIYSHGVGLVRKDAQKVKYYTALLKSQGRKDMSTAGKYVESLVLKLGPFVDYGMPMSSVKQFMLDEDVDLLELGWWDLPKVEQDPEFEKKAALAAEKNDKTKNNKSKFVGAVLWQMGNFYNEQKQYEKARSCFIDSGRAYCLRVLEILQGYHGTESIFLISTCFNIASTIHAAAVCTFTLATEYGRRMKENKGGNYEGCGYTHLMAADYLERALKMFECFGEYAGFSRTRYCEATILSMLEDLERCHEEGERYAPTVYRDEHEAKAAEALQRKMQFKSIQRSVPKIPPTWETSVRATSRALVICHEILKNKTIPCQNEESYSASTVIRRPATTMNMLREASILIE